jgi:NAD kinase
VIDRVVLVTKPTRLQELIDENMTEGAAQFLLESRGQSILPYQAEHELYSRSVDAIRRQLPNDLIVATVNRSELPHFLFRDSDLIVVCGPDGLFVNVAQYVAEQVVVGVNPDPTAIAGNLMPFSVNDVASAVSAVRSGRFLKQALPFVKATLGDERVVWGVNDIFIGRRDHISSRYRLSFTGRHEHHSSDGVIVSTGVGTAGWMRSVVAMVEGITNQKEHQLTNLPDPSDMELVFVVLSPFPSPVTGVNLVCGRVKVGQPLVLTSEMPMGGVVFSDGIVERGIDWPTGDTVTVTVGDRVVHRLVRA